MREAAASALGDIEDPRGVKPLIARLGSECGDAAAWALGKIGDPLALEALVEVVRQANNSNSIRAAAAALGRMRDGSVVEPLLAILKDSKAASFYCRREYIAMALGEIGDIRAATALKEMAENDPEKLVREEATKALTKLSDYTEGEASIRTVRLPPFETVTTQHVDEAVEIAFTRALEAIHVVTPRYIRGFCVETLQANPEDLRRLVNGPVNRLKDMVKLNLDRVPKHTHPGQQILCFQVEVVFDERCCAISIVVGNASGSPIYMFGVRLWRTKDEVYAYGWDSPRWISL